MSIKEIEFKNEICFIDEDLVFRNIINYEIEVYPYGDCYINFNSSRFCISGDNKEVFKKEFEELIKKYSTQGE